MMSYSIPAQVRPQYCLLGSLYGPVLKLSLKEVVKGGIAKKRYIGYLRENTIWCFSRVFPP